MNGTPHAPRVVVQGVERSFGSGERLARVLRGVDLSVAAAELVALYGPSGSGKTTLLNLIGALDRPDAGTIALDGQIITAMNERQRARIRRTQIGFIFQSDTLLPTYTAQENVDLALRLLKLGFRQRRRALDALTAVGLRAWANHVPDELSGGQRQRVSIARALAMQPALILADEPTNGLDTHMARRILRLFRHYADTHGTTFIVVTHDPLTAEFVDSVYDLSDGQVVRRLNSPTPT